MKKVETKIGISLLKKVLPAEVIRLIQMIKNFRSFVLVHGPLTYNQDGLATRHNCDFMKDELFMEAYTVGKKNRFMGGGRYPLEGLCCLLGSE